MSRQRKITDAAMEEFKAEAARRARGKSNKDLARLAGTTPHYAAQVVSTLRRMYEKGELVDVPCETTDDKSTEATAAL